MRIDIYTKTVLTVIAICLVWVCVRDLAFPVAAQRQNAGEQRVIISGVDIFTAQGRQQSLPIRIDGTMVRLPVSLEKINVEDTTKPKVMRYYIGRDSQMEYQNTDSIPVTLTKLALEPAPTPRPPGFIGPQDVNRETELPVSIRSIDVVDPFQYQMIGSPQKRVQSLPVHSPTPTVPTNRR